MTPIPALRARLLAITAVTALVGQRVHTLKLPQSPNLPAIRLQQIGRVEFMHLRGRLAIYRVRVQVDAVSSEGSAADPYAKAHEVASAAYGDFAAGVATGLCGYKGTVGGVEFTGIIPDGQREGYDPFELKQVVVSQDFFAWFRG